MVKKRNETSDIETFKKWFNPSNCPIRPTIQSTSKTNENLSTCFTNKLTNQRKKDIHITPINSIPQKMKRNLQRRSENILKWNEMKMKPQIIQSSYNPLIIQPVRLTRIFPLISPKNQPTSQPRSHLFHSSKDEQW
jgi:hypothetical protein